ncbi:threonine synthase [Clostridium tyrobutyricum]|uniref:Threonine synthase n=1 Tax=Clostridium tyrobutyricum DIVETGP TaxID=1408889 RepID=W6NEX3_CLOTY|nr:threonine synthase [Clostridium tyrobutyricum]AND84090.1 threonine synthase [Clostridium tyrobutyricum]ANP68820.1 threonine synthase [Clostridium tyrobutyricum]MBR9647233.1 threonine synthase [Clostridium tyrobutyricum]MBV4424885.1 threonine synthase [Clostridium tyrobutyricum]MBV4427106.1 threonine synthase [Clostridium tyrobutyricum]
MEKICYNSTRGIKENLPASCAILNGIAKDGGLFVPDTIPFIGDKLEDCKDMSYKKLASFIIGKFFTDIEKEELDRCLDLAYDNKFDSEDIVPLKKTKKAFYLELYHGPTLAFKDMALCLLPHLMKVSAKKQNLKKDIVILTATSGDTGKAALEGFADVKGTKIVVFFPKDGVSEIQRRQMITQTGANTRVIGIDGNFDDAQSEVKKIFNDADLKSELDKKGYVFSSANSINIGRLVPQIVYYFYGYMELVRTGEIKLGEKINFDVPTGNFGNILAAYYAKKMGLPIKKLICASNDNKVLFDFLSTGTYDKMRDFIVTISPSMDILVSSNLERLIYDISSRNSDLVNKLMNNLNEDGKYTITEDMKKELNSFYGGFASEQETLDAINYNFENYNYLMDTHTAVAHAVYKKYVDSTGDNTKTIIVSTASPFKFTKSVMSALDSKYTKYNDMELVDIMSKISGLKIPKGVEQLKKNNVIHKTTCEKNEMKDQILNFLLNK